MLYGLCDTRLPPLLPKAIIKASYKMCYACDRLGIVEDTSDTPEEHEDEGEEDQENQGPRLPRVQMASKAPREVTIVRPAPSHDGAPTFAAYSVLESRELDGDDDNAQRPPFGLTIYDTTPGADASRAAAMASLIFDRTMDERRRAENDPDRIEVVAFPLPDERGPSGSSFTENALSHRDRVDACIRHYERERVGRLAMVDAVEATSWFLPERVSDGWYTWGVIVIDRLEEHWADALDYPKNHPEARSPLVKEEDALSSQFGSFVRSYWQPRKEYWQRLEEPVTPERHVLVNPMKLELLGRGLGQSGLSGGVSSFYNHFLPDGILDRELEAARASQRDVNESRPNT